MKATGKVVTTAKKKTIKKEEPKPQRKRWTNKSNCLSCNEYESENTKPLTPPKAFLIGVRHKYPRMNGKTKRRQFLRVLARIA